MPATKFICPDGQEIKISKCLKSCPNVQRCMFLSTLRAVANSLNRKVLYALQGQAIHSINECHSHGEILSEERLKDEITSGQFDLFGKIIDNDDGVLGDLKVTSSYKLMKALGIYKVDITTGDFFKTGAKKGQPKTRKEFRYDGVKDVLEWAIQLKARI